MSDRSTETRGKTAAEQPSTAAPAASGVSDSLATAQAKTDSGISSPVGGSTPFGPAAVQAKDLAVSQRKPGASSGSESAAAPPSSGGAALPEELRAKMESAFQTDFSDVRVHQGSAASDIGAVAFTQGNNLHFAPGAYSPGTPKGDALIGHELTHVVQQRNGRVNATIDVNGMPVNDSAALEAEADSAGARAAAGQSANVSGGSSSTGVQRKAIQRKGNDNKKPNAQGELRRRLEMMKDDAYRWPLARYKWDQLQHDKNDKKLQSLVDQYESWVDQALLAQPEDADPVNAMRTVFSANSAVLTLQGPTISPRDIVGAEGLERVVHILDIFDWNLHKPLKEAFVQSEEFKTNPEAVAAPNRAFAWVSNYRNGYFDAETDVGGAITNGDGFAWWSAMKDGEATNLEELREALTLNDDRFGHGVVRFRFTPDMLAAMGDDWGIHKPTAFDGMWQGDESDPMFAANNSSQKWGMTKSAKQVREGVGKGIAAEKAQRSYVPGTIDDKYAVGAKEKEGGEAPKSANKGDKTKGDTDYIAWLKKLEQPNFKPPTKKQQSGEETRPATISAGINAQQAICEIAKDPQGGEAKARAKFVEYLGKVKYPYLTNAGVLDMEWGRFKTHQSHIDWTGEEGKKSSKKGDAPDAQSGASTMPFLSEEVLVDFIDPSTKHKTTLPARAKGLLAYSKIPSANQDKGSDKVNLRLAQVAVGERMATDFVKLWKEADEATQRAAMKANEFPFDVPAWSDALLAKDLETIDVRADSVEATGLLNPEPPTSRNKVLEFTSELATITPKKSDKPVDYRITGSIDLDTLALTGAFNELGLDIARSSIAEALKVEAGIAMLDQGLLEAGKALLTAEDEVRKRAQPEMYKFDLDLNKIEAMLLLGDEARQAEQSEEDVEAKKKADAFESAEKPGEPIELSFRTPLFEVKGKKKKAEPDKLVVHGTAVVVPLPVNGQDRVLSPEDKKSARMMLQGLVRDAAAIKVASHGVGGLIKRLDELSEALQLIGAGPLSVAGVSLSKLSPMVAQGADAEELDTGADEETGEGMVGLEDDGPSFLDSLEFEIVEKNGKKNALIKLAEWDMPQYGMKLRDGLLSARLNKKGGIKFIEDGTLTAIIAMEGVDTIEASLSSARVNRRGQVSGVGGVKLLTNTKPFGSGKLSFSVDAGSGGEIEIVRNVLHEIRSKGEGIKATAMSDGEKFLGLTVTGRLYNKLRKLDGTAKAVLLRQESIAQNLGPNGKWGLELLPSTNLDVAIKGNKLDTMSGDLRLGLEDDQGDFASISLLGATYEHSKKPTFSFEKAGASVSRPALLFSKDSYEFWLDAGTGLEVTAEKNEITSLSGTLPLQVRDAAGPLMRITLSGSFDGDNVTGSGTAQLERPFELAHELGPDKAWTIAILDDSALTATFTNTELTGINGTIHAGILDGSELWLTVHGSGAYTHANKSFSTTSPATVAVVKDQVIARRNTAAVTVLKDSGMSAVITANKLMSLSGSIGAKYSEDSTDYFKLNLEGAYDGTTGSTSGAGKITTLKDYSRKLGTAEVVLKAESYAEVKFADNAVTDVAGKASVDFRKDSLDLNVTGEVDYDVAKTNLRKLDGTITLNQPWKASEYVTVTEATASASLVDNELVSVDGTLAAEFSDKQGLLAKGSIKGGWSEGKVNGSGEVQLARNIDLNLGGGIVARVKGDKEQKLTYANVTLVDGAIEKLSGAINVDILREGKVIATIAVSGTYNLQTEVLEKLVADITIDGPFEFFDGGISVTQLAAHVEIENNTLKKVSGSAELGMAALNITKAQINFAWRTDGEQEYFSFDAKFWWVLFKEKAEGGGERSLAGMIDVKYNEDGTFVASAAVTYKMDDGFEAAAKVTITDDLIPLIEYAEIRFTKNLMDETELFDFEQRLFKLWFPIFYVLQISGYLDLGMSFTVGALDLDGKLGVYNWRPTVDGNIPHFKASLTTDWPLTFEARLTAGIEAGLDILIASAGIGMGASLVFEVPIHVKPSVEFEGGPEGFGGAFGMALSINPALFLEVFPYWFADVIFFGPWEGEFANWRFDLAQFAPIEWADTFEFGHRSKPVQAKKTPGKSQGLKEKESKKGKTKPPKNKADMAAPGAGPSKKKNTPAELPGGKTLSGDSLMGKQESAGKGADGKSDVEGKAKEKPQMERAMTGLQAGGRLIKTLFRFIKMIALGPVGIMFLMMDVAAGRLSFAQIKQDYYATLDGISAIIDMFGDTSKKWGFTYMLGEYIAGNLSLGDLLTKDDNLVRDAVKRGDHLAPALTADDHAGMLNIFMKGTNYCGDADEDAVLEILDAAGRAGHINATVSKTSGGYDQIYWKLDGEQDTKLTKLFKKYGVASSATARAIAAKAEVTQRAKRDAKVADASQEFTVLYNKLDRSWTRNEVADVLREKGEAKAISVAKGYIYKQSRARYYEMLADELSWGKRMEMWDYDIDTRIEKTKAILGPTKVRLLELRERAPKELRSKLWIWYSTKSEGEALKLAEKWLQDNNQKVKKGI